MSAGVAAIAATAVDRSAYGFILLTVAPIYVTCRSHLAYAGRLEDERRHRGDYRIAERRDVRPGLRRPGRLWNDAIERMTGIGREHVLKRQLFDAVPPSCAPACRPRRRHAAGRPGKRCREVEFDAAGSRRILHVRLLPFAAGVTGFVSDITDRTLVEEALQSLRGTVCAGVAGANDGIWDWDVANRPSASRRAGRRSSGWNSTR